MFTVPGLRSNGNFDRQTRMEYSYIPARRDRNFGQFGCERRVCRRFFVANYRRRHLVRSGHPERRSRRSLGEARRKEVAHVGNRNKIVQQASKFSTIHELPVNFDYIKDYIILTILPSEIHYSVDFRHNNLYNLTTKFNLLWPNWCVTLLSKSYSG